MEFSLVYMAVIENMKEAVIVLDVNLNVLYVNPPFEELTGLSGPDIASVPCKEVFKRIGLDCDEIIPYKNLGKKNWSIFRHVGLVTDISGREKDVKISVTPLFENNVVTGAIAAIEDITDLKEIEKKHEKTLIELENEVRQRREAEKDLRRIERSLGDAQRIAKLGNWDWDIKKDRMFMSDGMYRIFKIRKKKKLSGFDDFLHYIHADDREIVEKTVNDSMREHKPFSLDHRIVLADASEHFIHQEADVILNDKGKPVRIVGTVQNITTLRKTEEALIKSQEKYRELVQTANSIILRMDTEGIITFVNDYALLFFKYRRSQLIGKSIFETIVPEKDSAGTVLKNNLKNILKNPDVFPSFENQNIKKDGARVWVAWTNKGIYDDEGRLVEVLSIGNDITKIITAEEQLRLLMKGIDQANDAVLILDADYKIQYTNRLFMEKMVYNKAGIIGRTPWKAVKVNDRANVLREVSQKLFVDEQWDGEIQFTGSGGRILTGEMTIAPVKNRDKEVTHYILIIRDITARKNLEERINRLRREYEAFMRHELKNYITPIRSYSDLLLDIVNKNLTEKQSLYLTRIKENINRTVEFIDKLKVLQEFERGRHRLSKIECDLSEILGKVTEDMRILAVTKKVTIHYRNSLKNSTLFLDLALIPGVFVNLIKNAIEHVEDSPYETERIITIDAFNNDGYIVVTINNRGEPVPPERLKLFFEKFNSDKDNKFGGTGLGTTYAYLVTKVHGGNISVDSTETDGTTVTVKFSEMPVKNEKKR